jgi:RecJ-like exonuclease
MKNDTYAYFVRIEKAASAQKNKNKASRIKQTATNEAYKHFHVKDCPVSECYIGKVKTYERVTCKACKGKGGRTIYAITHKDGSHPFSKCGVCQGDGKRMKAKRNTCSTCKGYSKVYTYTGNFNFSDYEIRNIVRNQKDKIDKYNNR